MSAISMPNPAAPAYPLSLELDSPLQMARWRPFVNWLLSIPQLIVLYALNIVLFVLWVIAFFSILITARIPSSMFDFMVTIFRYQWRVASFYLFLREPYPPFDLTAASEDPHSDPAELSVNYPERLNRLLIFVKWLLAIPHEIVLFFLWIGAYAVLVVSAFVVLFTGRWPEGLREYVVGVARWTYRVTAYTYFLRDEYPPFRLT